MEHDAQILKEQEAYLTPRDVNKMFKMKLQTLANWRMLGKGPPYIKTGERLVRYKYSDVVEWLNKQRVIPGE